MVYSLNYSKVKMYNKDIKDFKIDDLKQDLGIKRGEINLIIMDLPSIFNSM